MATPKVSVCMVVYNHERYVAQAVKSALMQRTDFDYEIVIGEDCSTDGTRKILQDLAEKRADVIRLRLAAANQGGKANFVGAFAQCRGQYVVILEGDDYFTHPDKLQRQADALDARPDWSMCFHPAECRYEDGLTGPPYLPHDWQRPEATIVDLFARNFIATNAAMFRNRLFTPWPDWFLELPLGDWPIHILNAAHGGIGFLPEPMSAYRIHAKGIWSSQDLATKLTVIFRMLTAVDRHFGGKYSREIDEHRLATLQWLVAVADSTNNMPRDVDSWREAYEQARREANEMHLRYRELTASIPYRVARETVRPWKQLWSVVSRLRKDPAEPPPPNSAPPAANAA